MLLYFKFLRHKSDHNVLTNDYLFGWYHNYGTKRAMTFFDKKKKL